MIVIHCKHEAGYNQRLKGLCVKTSFHTRVFSKHLNKERTQIMPNTNLGSAIAELRRERGVTQEELARAVGVSGQAASKWENGGSPDIELLPAIADYFGVSIDALFGRSGITQENAQREAVRAIIAEKKKMYEKDGTFNYAATNGMFYAAFDLAWQALGAIFTGDANTEIIELQKPDARANESDYATSVTRFAGEEGVAAARYNAQRRFVMFMPQPPNGWRFDDTEPLRALFADLADRDFFSALLLVHRGQNRDFTSKKFAERLGVTVERAEEILAKLTTYWFIMPREIEIDDEIVRVYSYHPVEMFVPFLVFAEELLLRNMSYWGGWVSRNTPWIAE
jgi:transcriptional regulator with XRE-family HTH domain